MEEVTTPSGAGNREKSSSESPHEKNPIHSRKEPSGPLLVVTPTGLSDLLRSLPVLECLAASGRRLVVVAPAAFSRFLSFVPGVRSLVELSASEPSMLEALGEFACQEAVLLDESLTAARWVRRAGIARRWGYGGWLRRSLLDPGLQRPNGSPYYRRLVESLGMNSPTSWQAEIRLPEELTSYGRAYLRRAQIPEGCQLVGLFAGTDDPLNPRWPWQNFASLAQNLRKHTPSVRCVLVARSGDLWSSVRIHEETARFVPVIGPDLDLAELAGALSFLDLAVGNSGSLLELATALGVQTCALTSMTAGRPPVEGQEVLLGRSPTPPLSWIFRRSPLFSLEVETVMEHCEAALEEGLHT